MALSDGDILVTVPTLDKHNSCWALLTKRQIPCAKSESRDRNPRSCTSGTSHIWVTPDQIIDYLALKLVS